jgi:hypothetical protein
LVVSVLFGLAAAALERSLRLARQAGRWAFATAMLASLVVPVVTRSEPGGQAFPGAAALGVAGQSSPLPFLSFFPRLAGLEAYDVPLLILWIAGALFLLVLVLVTQRRVTRDAERGSPAAFDGVPVVRTKSLGPAVVGCMKSVIVLPAWMDDIDADWRRMTLLHEQQHLQAGDVRLMFVAVLVTVLQPWNLALWWQLRRLRQAIELDCDQRVLNAGVDIRAYSELLMEISRRRVPSWFPVVALANVRTFLARRITIMADHLAPTRHLKVVATAAAGTALIALGCHTPSPLSVNNAADTVAAHVKLVAEPHQDSTGFVTEEPMKVIHLMPRIRVREGFELPSLPSSDGTMKVLRVREEDGQAYVRIDLVHVDDPTAADVALSEEVPFEVRIEVVEGGPHIILEPAREPS